MNKIEFEKKYVDLFESLHLQLAAEFIYDLDEMVSIECTKASVITVDNMVKSNNSKMNRLDEQD